MFFEVNTVVEKQMTASSCQNTRHNLQVYMQNAWTLESCITM